MMLKLKNDLNESSTLDLISKLASLTKENRINLENNSRQLFEKIGKTKTSQSDSPSSKFSYILFLLSSVFLLTSWLGRWTNGGQSTITTTTTHMTPTTETPTNRTWKYNCSFGNQGRHFDG